MKNYMHFITYLIFLLFLTSCFSTTPKYLFAPNTTNLIQLKSKGDLKAALNYSSTSHPIRILESNASGRQRSNGIDLQTINAENEIMFEIMENTELLTDKLMVKMKPQIKVNILK